MRGHTQQAFAAMLNLRYALRTVRRLPQTLPQFGCFCGIADRDKLRPMPRDLPCERFQIAAGSQRHNAETLRQRLHHLKRLAADGTRRTEYGECFHEKAAAIRSSP